VVYAGHLRPVWMLNEAGLALPDHLAADAIEVRP
jgi:hypothetical protein